MLALLRNLNFPFFRIVLSERQSAFTREQLVTLDGVEVFTVDNDNVVAASPPE